MASKWGGTAPVYLLLRLKRMLVRGTPTHTHTCDGHLANGGVHLREFKPRRLLRGVLERDEGIFPALKRHASGCGDAGCNGLLVEDDVPLKVSTHRCQQSER
eukprot:9377251-Pyramimonas_sp.AAC.1